MSQGSLSPSRIYLVSSIEFLMSSENLALVDHTQIIWGPANDLGSESLGTKHGQTDPVISFLQDAWSLMKPEARLQEDLTSLKKKKSQENKC